MKNVLFHSRTMFALFLSLLATHAFSQSGQTVNVPGYANPWLAGMPDGSTADSSDLAPYQSPVQVSGLSLKAGSVLTFRASGGVSYGPDHPLSNSPDGDPSLIIFERYDPNNPVALADNGLSNIVAPANSLIGVFLGDDRPDQTSAPGYLSFADVQSRDYDRLAPALKQMFFIGDGLTSAGKTQKIVVPQGATRLYLGTMDGWGWWDNIGSFSVQISQSLKVTAIRLGLPDFAGQTSSDATITVPVYLKGEGSGSFSGRWELNGSDLADLPPSSTVDLSSGNWEPVDATIIQWSTMQRRNTSLTFVLNGPDAPECPPLEFSVTGFLPAVNGWPFVNNDPDPTHPSHWFHGVCLGMVVTARYQFVNRNGAPLPFQMVNGQPSPFPETFPMLLTLQRICDNVEGPILDSLLANGSSNKVQADLIRTSLQFTLLPYAVSLFGGDDPVYHEVLAVSAVHATQIYDEFNNVDTGEMFFFATYDPNYPGRFSKFYVSNDNSLTSYYPYTLIHLYQGPYLGYPNLIPIRPAPVRPSGPPSGHSPPGHR